MIEKRGTRFQVRLYDPRVGRKVGVKEIIGGRSSVFPTEKAAGVAEAKGVLALERQRGVGSVETCDEFRLRWRNVTLKHRDDSTWRVLESSARTFCAAGWADRPMNEVRQDDQLFEWIHAHPHAAVKCRTLFADAIRVYRHQSESGLVFLNPFLGLEIATGDGRQHNDPPSEAQVMALADAALEVFGEYGPTARAWILWQAFVGTRPAEAFALQRDRVSLPYADIRAQSREPQGNTGIVPFTKGHRRRPVYVAQMVQDALVADGVMGSTEWLFPSPQGKRVTPSRWAEYWARLREATGATFPMYELRHFAAHHWAVRYGVALQFVAKQLGNSPAEIERTYGHLVVGGIEHLRQAFERGPLIEFEAPPAESTSVSRAA